MKEDYIQTSPYAKTIDQWMVGLMGACPDGKGFTATFEEFKVTPLADQRRLEWAKRQMDK